MPYYLLALDGSRDLKPLYCPIRPCLGFLCRGEQAERYYNAFLQLGIFTRPLSYLGLRSLINISIGHPKATDFLLAKLEKLILSDAQQSRLD